MRLLLTRAVADAARTRAALEGAGHAALVSPVLAFAARDAPWPHPLPEGLIATSARAFMAITDDAPPRATRHDMPLFLVGRRTQDEARRHGFAGPCIVAPDGAALAAILCDRPAMRLLYLAAVDRKRDVEHALDATWHRLVVIETYEAVASNGLTAEALAALRAGTVDGVLHYSHRSAAIFRALAATAGIEVGPLIHFCFSADVATVFDDCGDVRIAQAPNDAAMMHLVGAG